MEKINIAELLKDCPKGMKVYSPLCGECEFDSLNWGTIICKKQNAQEITFTSEGYYMLPVFDGCECVLFPSKGNRDWSKFVPPCQLKNGDVVAAGDDKAVQMFIVEEQMSDCLAKCYIGYDFDNNKIFGEGNWDFDRLATEEEKQKLFDAIKDNGYHWDAKTKTLEKMIKPKFKIGDIIQDKDKYQVKIIEIHVEDEFYRYESIISKGICRISFSRQDDWELVPNKFDITTLKPFNKVLVRDDDSEEWTPNFYGYKRREFQCVLNYWEQCIPYEGNEHLLGTTNDCDDFYKTWE